MKYYYTDSETKERRFIDEHISDSVLKQYLENKYIGVIGLGCFIIGFLLGVLAYAL
jgi:hypothetical protein